ncbi:MAG: glycosyltransferase family 4 protein [Actinomycetota bacterium]|nr:glycosyltransferase family 4 protein [Actinomycetota bacterium]
MRIAVVYDCVFPSSTGGGERQYAAFARRFSEAGHEVTYLTRRQRTARPPAMSGVDVRAIAAPAQLYDAQGNRRLLPALGFAFRILQHFLRNRGRYDAVLVSALPAVNVPAVRAGLLGRPTVICADFLEVWRPEQWLQYAGPFAGRIARQLQRLAVLLAPLASCHSAMNGARLRAEGLRTPPIISPGLIEDIASAEPVLTPIDPPTLVFAGRMIPDKQVHTIPAALAWARNDLPTLRARLFGDGQQRTNVQREVDRLGLHDVVDLPGFVDEAELTQAFREASCLVNPSRREGYGIVVVEANAAGTPVVLVAAPDNASVELVTPWVNGVIAASTDPEVLGRAIVDVVTAGAALRAATYAWFCDAVKTQTMTAAADVLLGVLSAEQHRRAGIRA